MPDQFEEQLVTGQQAPLAEHEPPKEERKTVLKADALPLLPSELWDFYRFLDCKTGQNPKEYRSPSGGVTISLAQADKLLQLPLQSYLDRVGGNNARAREITAWAGSFKDRLLAYLASEYTKLVENPAIELEGHMMAPPNVAGLIGRTISEAVEEVDPNNEEKRVKITKQRRLTLEDALYMVAQRRNSFLRADRLINGGRQFASRVISGMYDKGIQLPASSDARGEYLEALQGLSASLGSSASFNRDLTKQGQDYRDQTYDWLRTTPNVGIILPPLTAFGSLTKAPIVGLILPESKGRAAPWGRKIDDFDEYLKKLPDDEQVALEAESLTSSLGIRRVFEPFAGNKIQPHHVLPKAPERNST